MNIDELREMYDLMYYFRSYLQYIKKKITYLRIKHSVSISSICGILIQTVIRASWIVKINIGETAIQ